MPVAFEDVIGVKGQRDRTCGQWVGIHNGERNLFYYHNKGILSASCTAESNFAQQFEIKTVAHSGGLPDKVKRIIISLGPQFTYISE